MRNFLAKFRDAWRTVRDDEMDEAVSLLREDVEQIKSDVADLQSHTGVNLAIQKLTKGKGE